MTNPTTPDIVERLRMERHTSWLTLGPMIFEAANEIERLRAEVEKLTMMCGQGSYDVLSERDDLRAQLAASEDRAIRALRLLRDKSQESISSHFNHAIGIAKGDIAGGEK